jgi:hypothetical protein
MLIIEGSDCLGKTTLAKTIVRQVSEMGIPVVYSWMTRPNEDRFDFFHNYKDMMNPCAVQDRFHLGGLAYHENKIPLMNLQIINSWIHSIGGLIVVLYARDQEWYRKLLKEDDRRSILSIDAMCKGNDWFNVWKDTAGADYTFNILPSVWDPTNHTPNYVKDSDIDELISEWIKRRNAVGLGAI